MKKNRLIRFPGLLKRYKKNLMIMKWCIAFICLFTLNLSANVYSQKNIVSLDLSDVSIEQFVKVVKQQTSLKFMYNSSLIRQAGKISVKVENKELKDVLSMVLGKVNLEYEFFNNVILIRQKGEGKSEQQKKKVVNGTVKDEHGVTLPGVSVLIKGESVGVATDINGKYSITIPENKKEVVFAFSFVGMVPVEVRYTGQDSINVVLKEDVEKIDEVVVNGYFTRKKESYTGVSTTFSGNDLRKVSTGNILNTLSMLDPSFTKVVNNEMGSDPNTIPNFEIRGSSSLKADFDGNPNMPTFIMDGFEISVQKLYDMDPSRIESITILKDAAATAMYGSRAANGVVIITTVTPKQGKVNIDYNFTGTLEYPDLTDYNLMNAREKLETEVAAGMFTAKPEDGASEQNRLDVLYNQKLNNVVRGVDTYWLSKPLRTVFNHKHSLYLDGGTDDLRWGADFSYNSGEGVMKGSYRDRMAGGLSLSYRLGAFQVRNYFSYTYTKSQESPYGSFSDYTSKLPYDEYKDENGKYLETTYPWTGGSGEVNPLYEATLKNYDRNKSWELINNTELLWNIDSYWLLKGQFSVTKSNSDARTFLDPRSKKNDELLGLTNVVSGRLDVATVNSLSWDATATLSYNRNIKKHNLNFLVGVNATSSTGDSFGITYKGFPSGELSSPGYANKVSGLPSNSDSKSRLFGALGTFNYSFDNIYLADVSVRFDGNSEFGADQRFAPFFSGGLGLNLHNYKFMKQFEWMDRLKIRGTYGITGKVDFSPYEAQTIYKIVTDNWFKTGLGASLMALGNSALGWEKTHNMDLGLDVDMFKGLFQMNFSYYRKKTVDLVNNVTLPSSTGFTSYKDNIGEVMNKGVEIQLRSTILNTKDWFVAAFANMAHNTNEITKISDSLKEYNKRVQEKYTKYNSEKGDSKYSETYLQYVEGGSLTSIFGVRSLGINPADGKEIYLRPDGTITYDWNAADQVVIGNEEPKLQGTFGFNLRWKQFSLYSTFMYEFGGQRYNSTLVSKVENAHIQSSNVDRRVLTGRWQNPGDCTPYGRLQTNGVVAVTRPTSRFVQDYNVLTFNSLTLGYDFDAAWVKKAHIGLLRVELSGNDLFRAATVRAERGLDYPYSRSFAASVKMSF